MGESLLTLLAIEITCSENAKLDVKMYASI